MNSFYVALVTAIAEADRRLDEKRERFEEEERRAAAVIWSCCSRTRWKALVAWARCFE